MKTAPLLIVRLLSLTGLLCMSLTASAQIRSQTDFEVHDTIRAVELASGTSNKLVFEYDVPEMYVENPDIVRVTPISPNELVITGLKPGVSTLTVSDKRNQLKTLTINVTLDVRKLELALAQHFPDSAIKVNALQTGVILKGSVARAEDIPNVLQVSQDFFPTTIVNQLQVHGSQTVAIEVKLYEVSRTRLRNVGIDWSLFGRNVNVVSGFADLIQNLGTGAAGGDNLRVGISSGSTDFNAVLNLLERNSVARLMAQPTLITQNGRPAEFLSGVEVPIQVAAGLGVNSIEFRAAGTKLDVVPIIHGEGEMTLQIRAEVSEVANDLGGAIGVPGFRVRRVNTGVPMRAGQTLALAGDYSEKSDAENRGMPGMLHRAWSGLPFRNTQSNDSETELVFLITPRFINPVDAAAMQGPFPGRSTMSPSNRELFINGHIEVPVCQDDCPPNSPYAQPRYNALRQGGESYQFGDTGNFGFPAQQGATTNQHNYPTHLSGKSEPVQRSRFGYPESNPPASSQQGQFGHNRGSANQYRR